MWRAAIIGCGNIAGGYDESSTDDACQTHAKACRMLPEVELVAVCDRDPGKAEKFADRWEARSFHADASEMLACARPHIVSICSPTATHTDLLELCLESPGLRAILCEKPAGFDSARLQSILAKIDAAGLVFAANYSRAYAPGIQRWRQRPAELGGCIEARVDYGKGIFSYGSHAIQWLADWLGEISNVEVTGGGRWDAEDDPSVDAKFHAGTTPVRMFGGSADRFDVEFRCTTGVLRFSNYAYTVIDGRDAFATGLEKVMLDVYSNLVARLEGRPGRLVEGAEALAVLDLCDALARQASNFS